MKRHVIYKSFSRPLTLIMLRTSLMPLAMGSVQESPDPRLRNLLIEAVNNSNSFEDRFDAEVWLSDMSRRMEPSVKDAGERLGLLRPVSYEAVRAGMAA